MPEINPDEVAYYLENRSRLASTLGKVRRDIADDAILEALSRPDAPITPPVVADYRLPEHFARTVSKPELAVLRSLLGQLWSFREQLVGLTEIEAQALYNGDDFALLLREELHQWVTRHLRARLARPSPRDENDPFATFFRLEGEVLTWYHALATAPSTGHLLVIDVNRAIWELYAATWGRLSPEAIDELPEWLREFASEFLDSEGWTGLLGSVIDATPQVAVASSDVPRLRAELAVMAQDLVEARPLLVRSFKAEDHVVPVAPGVFATWIWQSGHQAGAVVFGDDEDRVRRMAVEQYRVMAIGVGLDGTPFDLSLSWIGLDDDAIPWAVGLVRPVHRRIVEAWLAADRPSAPATDDVGEGEVLAVLCEHIAAADEPAPSDPTAPRTRIPSLRRTRLYSLLERLGCEISQGKGSEVTVWRKGGRKYTLGGHERNTPFPSHIVRAVLKTVGISVAELAACAR